MAIPTTFAPVRPQDFTLTPISVNKQFTLTSASVATTESGYFLWEGLYSGLITPVGTEKASNDPTNSIDGSYKHVIWRSIDHQYYRHPYDRMATLEHANPRYTYKHLNLSASILSCPYLDYGERIKPGSVEVTNSFYGFNLTDDENGNLYDPAIDTGSFADRNRLVAYWGFNEAFRKFKYGYGTLSDGELTYTSRTFTPDEPSIVRNVEIRDTYGLLINSTSSGMGAYFDDGFIITHDRQDFNFDSTQDFTISFWMKCQPDDQQDTSKTYNAVISKRGAVRQQKYGFAPKYNQNNLVVETQYVSTSLVNEPTNVYPYDFRVYNQTSPSESYLEFARSDGANRVVLKHSIGYEGLYDHVCVTKSGSLLSLYHQGELVASASDTTRHPINKHALLFGAEDLNGSAAYFGFLDEIRMYDYAVPPGTVASLANSHSISPYQTAVVGNVFYRTGTVVLSSLDPKYQNTFAQNWVMRYRGTHTIYQYEVLCRVKKGAFNLTYNPTARVSPNSDLFSNDMTGSLLLPYATTIGMYNDAGELMAVAKLGQPIQMRADVDLNFMVRWDI
jgi:hypothetical protein